MEFISICSITFVFLILISFFSFIFGLNFLVFDYFYFIEWELLSFNSSILLFVFLFDWMSLMFMSFVLFISSFVIYYSKDYMMGDCNLNRFILLVLLFVFSMMMLIISPNLVSILLGWDGLGLVSYCLVIYYQNVKSFNAGMLTALSNRLGDVAFLVSIAWMLNFGSWNFMFYTEFMKLDYEMEIILLCMVLAAMTKSAQIPFSSWLPAAMAAPTPVSALVHSSTLVTAGVYLLIRFNLLLMNTYLSKFLMLIAGLTMFMAGLGANFEFDLKKIIALSTLSQLGLMLSILALGVVKLAFFHLLTHALFKALLFMCAGAVIHVMKNSQDIRDMGGLVNHLPMVVACLNVSNLALCGMPFLAGFYSKDQILEMVLVSNINSLMVFLFFIATGFTVSYSFRLFYYSLVMNMNQSSMFILEDSSKIMNKSMFFLLVLSILGGSFLNWLIFPFTYVFILSFLMKWLTIFICFIGALVGYYFSSVNFFSLNKSSSNMLLLFMNFSGMMWFLPFLATMGVNYFPLSCGMVSIKGLDQGWIEFFGVSGIYSYFKKFSLFNQIFLFNNLKINFIFFSYFLIFLFLFILFF